ncbi:MAG TPA: MmcQ/YjbR family DNA-binding protein [Bryobacteraceae bacterium]|nr:MmcQ/YjbR family DNA-binding protein [Bryobacteraceae bacterium]
MDAADFRRIALSLEGAEEGSHMGSPDFRVGGRVFATLASAKQGYGNLMLTPEQQAEFVAEQPDLFVPIAGGWGRMGATHIRLDRANEDMLAGALRTAWKLRIEKNGRTGPKKPRVARVRNPPGRVRNPAPSKSPPSSS